MSDIVRAEFEDMVGSFPTTKDGIVAYLEKVFEQYPPHQQAAIQMLIRSVARDHILVHETPADALPYAVSARYVALMRELATFSRLSDEVRHRRTEVLVSLIHAMASTIEAEVRDVEMRERVLASLKNAVEAALG